MVYQETFCRKQCFYGQEKTNSFGHKGVFFLHYPHYLLAFFHFFLDCTIYACQEKLQRDEIWSQVLELISRLSISRTSANFTATAIRVL